MTAEWNTDWFVPTASTLPAGRASLDLGLMRAERFYRELAVPGIGGIRFTRQVSWSIAAIALAPDMPGSIRPLTLAHAIEALANKVVHRETQEPTIGSRAFGKYPDAWDFTSLSKEKFYVRNTLRQAASRALRTTAGLGFVNGRQFNSYSLTQSGDDLADAFLGQRAGGGRSTLRSWIVRWISGKGRPGNNHIEALGAGSVSKVEQALMRGRLLGVEGQAGDKRRALRDALNSFDEIEDPLAVVKSLKDLGHKSFAQELEVALCFGRMFDAARAVVASATGETESMQHHKPQSLSAMGNVKDSIGSIKKCARDYKKMTERYGSPHVDASNFANTISSADSDGDVLLGVIRRDGQIMSIADGLVVQGPLFREMETDVSEADGDELDANEFSERAYRLRQFLALMIEVDR